MEKLGIFFSDASFDHTTKTGSIGFFNLEYPLDMLDHWYFREIKRNDKEIYLLNSNIKQELSIYGNFEENLSVSRYYQLLKDKFLQVVQK